MAAALGRLFVTSAAARAGASRESRVARVAFPTPDGWFEPGRREETVAPLAARRLIADARPALACGLTLRGLDPDRFTNRGEGRDEGAAKRGVVAAGAVRHGRRRGAPGGPAGHQGPGRLAARLLAAAGRALSGADASAAKACLMASAGVRRRRRHGRARPARGGRRVRVGPRVGARGWTRPSRRRREAWWWPPRRRRARTALSPPSPRACLPRKA